MIPYDLTLFSLDIVESCGDLMSDRERQGGNREAGEELESVMRGHGCCVQLGLIALRNISVNMIWKCRKQKTYTRKEER